MRAAFYEVEGAQKNTADIDQDTARTLGMTVFERLAEDSSATESMGVTVYTTRLPDGQTVQDRD